MLTDTLLLIPTLHFTANPDTISTNFYQQKPNSSEDIAAKALQEFEQLVNVLHTHHIQTLVLEPQTEVLVPDALFPNNWISFHQGKVILYPMYGHNRRSERRIDAIDVVKKQGFVVDKIVDWTNYEQQNQFLEGTGSLVLDRVNCIAYACLSERTHEDLVKTFCQEMNYEAVVFVAEQHTNQGWKPIYHTNVMMAIGEKTAVVCLESIRDENERNKVIQSLQQTHKEIVELSFMQKNQFAGNMLQVKNTKGQKFWVMSESAYKALHPKQIEQLSQDSQLIYTPIPTIEKYGGGSVRCMLCEVF